MTAPTWKVTNANGVGNVGMHVAVVTTENYKSDDVRLPWGFTPIAAVASVVTPAKAAVGTSGQEGYQAAVPYSVKGVDGSKVTLTHKSEQTYTLAVTGATAGSQVTVMIYGAPNATFQ